MMGVSASMVQVAPWWSQRINKGIDDHDDSLHTARDTMPPLAGAAHATRSGRSCGDWGIATICSSLIRSAREVARGLVARLVAEGQRDTYQWTAEKSELLDALDAAGVSSIFADPEYGGTITGPKNLATALAAFELAWVDGGAATCLVALGLALQPIIALGTDQQKATYLTAQCADVGRSRHAGAGRFLPDRATALRGSRYRDAVGQSARRQWQDGETPVLHVQKRGRFTNNMDFASSWWPPWPRTIRGSKAPA